MCLYSGGGTTPHSNGTALVGLIGLITVAIITMSAERGQHGARQHVAIPPAHHEVQQRYGHNVD